MKFPAESFLISGPSRYYKDSVIVPQNSFYTSIKGSNNCVFTGFKPSSSAGSILKFIGSIEEGPVMISYSQTEVISRLNILSIAMNSSSKG